MQNLVILAGNVGNAPETRTTQGGTKITSFSLATSRPKRGSAPPGSPCSPSAPRPRANATV